MRRHAETIRWWMHEHGQHLGGNLRAVYDAIYVDERGVGEVAYSLGLSRSTVQSYMRRLAQRAGCYGVGRRTDA